jgi:two-component system response regulator VicR
MRVLILDDSEIVGGLVSFMMERKGLETNVFSKGVEALNFLTDEEQPYPDLMVIDHYLSTANSVRKTGFMVLKALNKLGKKIPVIVLSSLKDERIKNKYFDMGVVDFVCKDDYDFIDTLEDSVNRTIKEIQRDLLVELMESDEKDGMYKPIIDHEKSENEDDTK